MLLGEFEHTIDDKNRLTLPAKFREALSGGVVLTRGMDGCLYCYPRAEWERSVEGRLAGLDPLEREAEGLARAFGVRVLRSPRPIDPARRQLDEYFAGKRRSFNLPVDLRLARDFGRTVLQELARVPYGELTTYGTLAARAGHPRAARAVGTVMNRNPVPIVLPCHRVVGSTGALVGYGGGLERKRALLELEGALLPGA